MMRRPARN